MRLHIFVETDRKELLWVGKTVAVEMINRDGQLRVGLNQGVGGAFDRAAVAQRSKQPPHKGGFAGTELTNEKDDPTVGPKRGQRCRSLAGSSFVGKEPGTGGGVVVHAHPIQPQGDWGGVKEALRRAAAALGFTAMAVGDGQLEHEEPHLLAWLAAGCYGEMDYMAKWGVDRARVRRLVPEAQRVISLFFPYWPAEATAAEVVLTDPALGYLSRYALGRDYHKVVRERLKRLEETLQRLAPSHQGRVFVDSAPIWEVAHAARAGLGWRGKHTLLLTRHGSYGFLGELVTNLPLPVDEPVPAHCGRCTRCLTCCPTQAIVAPYQLDARRCISYLTIEHRGPIPEPLRPLIGNRIYGCDDCQLVCPWNRFAQTVSHPAFAPRHGLDAPALIELFGWDEVTFLDRFAGSAVRRIGYERWLRNLAVALGNAPTTPEVVAVLSNRRDDASPLVREHVAWALARHHERQRTG